MQERKHIIWFCMSTVLLLTTLAIYLLLVRPYFLSFKTTDIAVLGALQVTPADTYVYWFHAVNSSLEEIPLNLFGPVVFIKLLNCNFDLIFLIQFILFFFSVRGLVLHLRISGSKFVTLVLLNPLMLFQFLGPNKEIMIMLSLLFLTVYAHSNRYFYLIIGLIVATFTKPAFFGVVIFFLIVRKIPYYFRPFIYFFILGFLSLLYPQLPYIQDMGSVLLMGQTEGSLGLTVFLHELGSQYYMCKRQFSPPRQTSPITLKA